MRKYILSLATLLFLICSCSEEIDTSARYVFTDYTVASYLEAHSEYSQYLELTKLVPVSGKSQSSVYQLLTARGNYTCFALTNKAIDEYLQDLVAQGLVSEPSWDAFYNERKRDSVLKVVVLNTVIDGHDTETQRYTIDLITSFGGGSENAQFPLPTIYDHRLTYSKGKNDTIFLDKDCPIDPKNCDIPLINGVLHQLHKVIAPLDESCARYIQNILDNKKEGYLMFAKALQACNLLDTLSAVMDDAYEKLYQDLGEDLDMKDYESKGGSDMSRTSGDPHAHAPEHRKYGFTLFAETDEFWEEELGKDRKDITKEDVIAWVEKQGYYPDAVNDDNYTDENNLLNQFVTYHLLPARIPVDKLALHYNEKGFNYKNKNAKPTVPVWAHYVTFGKRRLLRIWESAESMGPYLNRFPKLSNGRRDEYHETECTEANQGVEIRTDEHSGIVKLINAIIYPIHQPIAYSENVRNQLAKTRLRYDAWELQPEAMNNEMRLTSRTDACWYFSSDPDKQYFDNMTVNSKQTRFMLLSGRDQNWPNYQGDEVLSEGVYDITITCPPVPKYGIYEIRMGVSTYSGTRGICQVYWGPRKDQLVAQGIPVNMQLGGNSTGNMLGWEVDTDDDDYNAEVDKKMRNNGFLKGPEYIVANAGGRETNRMNPGATRRIVVREPMSPDVKYYIRFKTVQPDYTTKQLFVDYLEWCPKEVYDNPEHPEDIW